MVEISYDPDFSKLFSHQRRGKTSGEREAGLPCPFFENRKKGHDFWEKMP